MQGDRGTRGECHPSSNAKPVTDHLIRFPERRFLIRNGRFCSWGTVSWTGFKWNFRAPFCERISRPTRNEALRNRERLAWGAGGGDEQPLLDGTMPAKLPPGWPPHATPSSNISSLALRRGPSPATAESEQNDCLRIPQQAPVDHLLPQGPTPNEVGRCCSERETPLNTHAHAADSHIISSRLPPSLEFGETVPAAPLLRGPVLNSYMAVDSRTKSANRRAMKDGPLSVTRNGRFVVDRRCVLPPGSPV